MSWFKPIVFVAAALLMDAAQASPYAVLSLFGSGRGDGYELHAPVIFGPDGVLYGTTANGGTIVKSGACELGCGTVFRLDRSGRHVTLHDFSGAGSSWAATGGSTARPANRPGTSLKPATA